MKTEKLFVKNVYLKEADLKLLELQPAENCIKASFESTIFFPTGGGQLCDAGVIAGHTVLDVHEDKETGIIWHSLDPAGDSLVSGNIYHAKLDWNKRFSHMQMHCGEHLLSGAFLKLYGAANKGFHMGDDYVTIDIDCPSKEITKEMARKAEALANEYIAMNIPVETRFFDTADEAMSLPCRKQIKFGKDISVVLIGDASNPADCCACCGTHPAYTGEIGLIKITHCEKYKGMSRYYVKCGMKALEDYSKLQDITENLGRHYSCEPEGLFNAVSADQKRNEELYKKFTLLKEHCIVEARKEIADSLNSDSGNRCFNYDYFDANELQQIGQKLNPSGIIVLTSNKEKCCILVSDGTTDCGALIKSRGHEFGARGGGKKNIARAVFDTIENMHRFISAIQ